MIRINNLAKGIFCVIGAFLLHFSLGTLFTFGNISPYIASYLKYRTKDTWITNGHMIWVFSITVFFQGTIMAVGGLLEKKIGARITCLCGSWIMSIGIIFTYFSIKINIWLLLFTYGIAYGFGIGIAYSVAMAAAMSWFPLKRGTIAGIVTGGFGLGSFIFNLIQTAYINPNNVSPNSTTSKEKYFTDSSVLNNVPFCFVIIGSAYALMQLIGVILLADSSLKKPSKRENFINADETVNLNTRDCSDAYSEILPVNNSTDESKLNDDETLKLPDKNGSQDSTSFTIKDSLKSCQLWILCLTFFFNGIYIVIVSSYYKNFGQTFIKNDKYFSIVGAVAAIFNSAGRIVWGRIIDSMTYRKVMTGLTILKCLSIGAFYLCSFVNSKTGSEAMYFIWVCWLFFCVGGNFGIFPAITSQCFGNANLAVIYGFVFSGYSFSGIIGGIVFSMIIEKVNYGGIFIIATVSSLLSLTLTQFFRKSIICRKKTIDNS